MFDKNNDGKLNFEEIKNGLKMIGEKMTDQEIQDVLNSLDKDKNGTLDIFEFINFIVNN